MKTFPLSIRDVSPHPDAVRLTGTCPNGAPSGTHTGGAWLWQGEVYKPLDCRPCANAEYHIPTQEDIVLNIMAGQSLFPLNWRVETINQRRFLVRKKAHLVPEDVKYKELDDPRILLVEQGVRALNHAKWEIGDPIALALDAESYEPFLYDLSNAHPQTGKIAYEADDEWRVLDFFRLCKREWLADFREHARHVVSNADPIWWDERRKGYRNVYASFNRPFSLMWASLSEEPILIHNDFADFPSAIPWTWVVTKTPLPEKKLFDYELRWGWSPIHEEE